MSSKHICIISILVFFSAYLSTIQAADWRNAHKWPLYAMYVDDFYMGKYEVSLGEYPKFLQATDETDVLAVGELFQKSRDRYHLQAEAKWGSAAREEEQKVRCSMEKNTLCPDEEKIDTSEESIQLSFRPREYRIKSIQVAGFPAYSLGLDIKNNVWDLYFDWYQKNAYSSNLPSNPQEPVSDTTHHKAQDSTWTIKPLYVPAVNRDDSSFYTDSYLGFRLVFQATCKK